MEEGGARWKRIMNIIKDLIYPPLEEIGFLCSPESGLGPVFEGYPCLLACCYNPSMALRPHTLTHVHIHTQPTLLWSSQHWITLCNGGVSIRACRHVRKAELDAQRAHSVVEILSVIYAIENDLWGGGGGGGGGARGGGGVMSGVVGGARPHRSLSR